MDPNIASTSINSRTARARFSREAKEAQEAGKTSMLRRNWVVRYLGPKDFLGTIGNGAGTGSSYQPLVFSEKSDYVSRLGDLINCSLLPMVRVVLVNTQLYAEQKPKAHPAQAYIQWSTTNAFADQMY